MRLFGKTALITGAGAGIGAATALLFCREGASVTLVDSDSDALNRSIEAITLAIPNAQLLKHIADVSDEASAFDAVEKTVRRHEANSISWRHASTRCCGNCNTANV